MGGPLLSVILVNYRSEALLQQAILSFLQYNAGVSAEIIVVDNSASQQPLSLPSLSSPIVYLPMPGNAGFARANNAGLAVAKGEVLLLLNPDTVCTGDDLSRLAHRLLDDLSVAAAGVQLVDGKGVAQISGHRFVPWGLNHLLPLPYWGALLKRLTMLLGAKPPHERVAAAEAEVDWLSGACLALRREVYEITGGMDEDFFLYAEEVEWCYRLRKEGRMVIFGDLHIVHLEGGSIDAAAEVKERGYYNLYDRKGLQLMVSNHLRVRKQYGTIAFLFLLLNYTWGVPFFMIAGFLHRLFTLRNPVAHFAKAGAFGLNVLRLWRLAPAILLKRRRLYRCL